MRLVYESASDTDVDMSAVVLKRLPAHFGLGLLFRKKYWICFFKVDCMSFFGQDAKKWKFSFFAVSGKVKTNIWINIDLRKQLDSWEIFDIFRFEKTNIQIYGILYTQYFK